MRSWREPQVSKSQKLSNKLQSSGKRYPKKKKITLKKLRKTVEIYESYIDIDKERYEREL